MFKRIIHFLEHFLNIFKIALIFLKIRNTDNYLY